MASRNTGEMEDVPLVLMLFLFYTMNRIVNSIKSKSDSLNLNDGILALIQATPSTI